jgi:glycerol uptake facilitator protein
LLSRLENSTISIKLGGTTMGIFAGELLGTMMLILLGDGAIANVLLNKSKGQGSGWIVITAGWAFGLLVGIFTAQAFGSPLAHLNPAVTIAFIAAGNQEVLANIHWYILGQFIGAFLGAVLVWLAYLPHWAETHDKALKLAVFCTGPAIRNTGANLISEIIGTFVLVFGIAVIFRDPTPVGYGDRSIVTGLGPFLVAVLFWGIGLSLGGPTFYALNPARDLGPRLAHAALPIAGKGESDWEYFWIPVVGPIIGGIVAAVVLLIL